MLTEDNLRQIRDHGLSISAVEQQIKNFRNGFPPSDLAKPALVDEGILKLSDSEIIEKAQLYESHRPGKDIVKFVPASGAATRMFKSLFSFLSEYDGSDSQYDKLISDKSKGSMYEFLKNLEKFAFYEDLKTVFEQTGMALEEAHVRKEYSAIVDNVLSKKGLGYGSLPKGLLKFHSYEEGSRTPLEEHIVEGCQHAITGENQVRIHFTVSPEHLSKFKKLVSEVQESYENQYSVSLDISYSVQKTATDTIAVDLNNEPFINDDGSILFRPAGHGALLENLNDIDADIVFLKNIDNVLPDRLKDTTIRYKKVIGGVLVEAQTKIKEYIQMLHDTESSEDLIDEINAFVHNHLGLIPSKRLNANDLVKVLNRPVRVCGMVKNEGEPGGGPFWVKSEDGTMSLQIVESAQIDLTNHEQKGIMEQSTHFNPVDVVCGVKDYSGEKFDLLKFRDLNTGFITQKSKDGRDLKAQELPGLWNGSMANWNTIFVEVPLITFNPVKTVNDLLKEEHL